MPALVLLTILALSFVSAISPIAQAEVLSGWTASPNNYDNGNGGGVYGESCVIYSGYIYCLGGDLGGAATGKAFYAQLNAGSNGAWSSTTAYPTSISSVSCVAYSGYIYCVGGISTTRTSAVYYASLSSSGIGSWTETTDYGASSGTSGSAAGVSDLSCAASSGYIYCVNGDDQFGARTKVYYAQLSSSGVGAWTETTDYGGTGTSGSTGLLVTYVSCATSGGYIYCVGGSDNSGNPKSNVYYAPVSSSGVGAWTETTDYGDSVTTDTSGSAGVVIYGTSCTVYLAYMYCIDGVHDSALTAISSVYYAQLTSSGVGAWTSTTSYGLGALGDMPCASSSAGYVYCVGGLPNLGGSETYGIDYAQVQGASPVPDLPYGVIPLLFAIPALYYLISRRHARRGSRGVIE